MECSYILFALLQGGALHGVLLYSFCFATGWSITRSALIFSMLCYRVEHYMECSYILNALLQGGALHVVFLFFFALIHSGALHLVFLFLFCLTTG